MRLGIRTRRAAIAWTVAVGGVALASVAFAQAPRDGGPGLDRLLRLPDSVEFSSELKGGATRSEWRQRFSDARAALAKAEAALAESQDKLAAAAGEKSEWQFSPPGVPARQPSEDSSSNFSLREQVRRNRGEVDRAKARLRELNVEANLAGVPEEWRAPSTEPHPSDTAGDDSATRATTSR